MNGSCTRAFHGTGNGLLKLGSGSTILKLHLKLLIHILLLFCSILHNSNNKRLKEGRRKDKKLDSVSILLTTHCVSPIKDTGMISALGNL